MPTFQHTITSNFALLYTGFGLVRSGSYFLKPQAQNTKPQPHVRVVGVKRSHERARLVSCCQRKIKLRAATGAVTAEKKMMPLWRPYRLKLEKLEL